MNSNRISHALESLNSFHSNIKFTAAIEKGNEIAFLDILIRYKDLINSTLHRKKMITNLYINWKSFSPNNWKWGTLNKLLSNNTKIEIAFKSTKLSSCFNVKDKIDSEYNHDLIYHAKCTKPTCIDDYVGESGRRIK